MFIVCFYSTYYPLRWTLQCQSNKRNSGELLVVFGGGEENRYVWEGTYQATITVLANISFRVIFMRFLDENIIVQEN